MNEDFLCTMDQMIEGHICIEDSIGHSRNSDEV